jgi:O-antigen/teichoic acid export membrane protein
MAITSLLTLVNFSDLGISLGLTKVLADADGRGDQAEARTAVSSALAMLTTIGFAVLVAFALLYPLVPWSRVFNNVDPRAAREAGPATAAFVLSVAVSFPLGVVGRIQMGRQDGVLASAYQMLGAIIGLAATVAAVWLRAGLPVLILAASGAPSVAALVNTVVSFGRRYRWLRPRQRDVDRDVMRGLLSVGGAFLVLQVGFALSSNADSFLITRTLGPAAVADYAVAARLFSLATVAVAVIAAPLFSPFAEASSRGDHQWLHATARRLFVGGLGLAAAPAIILVVVGPRFIAWWAGPNVHPTRSLLVALGVFVLVDSIRITLATYFSATSQYRIQLIAFGAYVPLSILARIVGVRAFGLTGLVTSHVLCFATLVCVPFLFKARPVLLARRSDRGAFDATMRDVALVDRAS